MNIKQASQETGLSEDILRFYEKKNLIHPRRNPGNGYRDYTFEDITKIIQIRQYNTLGIPLTDIDQIFQNEDPSIGLNCLNQTIKKMEEEQRWMDIKIASAKDLAHTFEDIQNNRPFRILQDMTFHYYKKPSPGTDIHNDYVKTINQIQALNYSFRIAYTSKDQETYPNDIGIISMLPLPLDRLDCTHYEHVTVFRIYYPTRQDTFFNQSDYNSCEELIRRNGCTITSDCFCSQIFSEAKEHGASLLSANFIVSRQ